jgi:hypothetical protein
VGLDHYAKIKPGDFLPGIPSRPWNDMLDLLSEWKGGKLGRGPGGAGVGQGDGIVSVHNGTGDDLPRFSVLGITGFLISPADNLSNFKNSPCLRGGVPIATDLERFVILQQPCRQDAIADGLLLGLSPVQIDVIDETDDYADLIVGDTAKLRSQPYGSAWIAYKESGTGTKWGLVVHGVQGSQFALGKTNTAVAKGTGATNNVDVYRGTTAGSEANTGSTKITAWNHFADVASGKWVLCVRLQRNWRLVAAEC